MPEIAEVARIVHFLRQHLVGKHIASASAIDDGNVFGKVGTSGAEVEAALRGKKVVKANTSGNFSPSSSDSNQPLTTPGWVHIRGVRSAYTNYYKKMKDGEEELWPPKYWKFHLETDGKQPTAVAFTDSRRFGRVRLVDCVGSEIRQHSPLVENGPDPVQDTDIFTEDFLRQKMRARHVPIKALLLDQTVISGIGNWVADETLYQAKLHPEQYCNEFSDAEIAKLFESIRYVCQTAVDELGDSDKFPEHWLFNFRWDKGKKGATDKLPNGDKLAFITVGGRTSCYAPAVQRKTGHVPESAKVEPLGTDSETKPTSPELKKVQKASTKVKDEVVEDKPEAEPKTKKKRGASARVKDEVDEDNQEAPPNKKQTTSKKAAKGVNGEGSVKHENSDVKMKDIGAGDRRRSARLRG